MTCPSTGDLYDFFSKYPIEDLDPDIKAGIGIHVSMCQDCADIGKDIQQFSDVYDDIVDSLERKPMTDEEKAAVERAITRLKKRIVN